MLSDVATFLDLRMIDDASAFLPGSIADRAIDMRDPAGRHVSTLYTGHSRVGHTAIEAVGGVEAKSRPLQLVRK